ncbi:hypothetical protein ACF9IK_34580 [Kitasatospora hibisci]|uniref:hypothetical protein n=1 Tax=Kitasatospora hibisci TaxID=3369522 RepID=UPI0037544B84
MEKFDHEDEALQDLIAALAAGGRHAALTAHPDRDASHPLTVDGILLVDGVEWAVDHCLLSQDSRLIPAIDSIDEKLRAGLEAVVQEYKCALVVSVQPQDGKLGRARSDAYVQSVIDQARNAAKTGQDQYGDDGFTSTQIIADAPVGIDLIPFMNITSNARLDSQIAQGIGAALEKKLTKQLKNAKDAGFPVMLLLDQRPRPGARNGTVWQVGHGNTVLAAVQPVLDLHPGVVDLLWYRPLGGGPVELLVGELPSTSV